MHLLSLDSQGQPQAPPKPGSAPTGPVVVPNLPAQKISARVNDPETQRKVGKPSKKPLNTAQCTSIIDALKEVYKLKVKPLEEAFKFGSFFSPVLNDADFDGKPQVLLLGQYSTGKTTFIKHLIGRDYPGCHIGPEPTTDRFVVVNYGIEDRFTPGNTLAVQPDQPYSGLSNFGSGFLSKFQSSSCKAKLLEEISIVDTPGVLSGEKQKLGRSYDFIEVTRWFAQRADLILLLFDAHKLDISDEFQSAIKCLKGQDDKIRVVLNKADKVTSQQLMRVYGAMMWSLGKVVNTPEVMRVYIGSFWDGPCQNMDMEAFFKMEQGDLLRDLHELPRNAAVRKINELVKRARMAKIHALIIGHLKGQMPFFGQAAKQKALLENLADEFFAVMKKYRLPQGDFPNIQRFKEVAGTYDFGKFAKLNEKMMQAADDALTGGIPMLLRQLADEQGGEHRYARRVATTCQRRDHADLQVALDRAERLPQRRAGLGRGGGQGRWPYRYPDCQSGRALALFAGDRGHR